MMKRVRILEQNIGLVFKNGALTKVLTEGVYWIMFYETCQIFKRTEAFQYSLIPMNVLMKNEALANELIEINVADNEIAILYKDGKFEKPLTKGRYFYWKGVFEYTYKVYDMTALFVQTEFDKAIIAKSLTVASFIKIVDVFAFEKAVLTVDGKYNQILNAGRYYCWKNDKTIKVDKVDMRTQGMEVSGQEILTKDKANLRMNFSIQFKVTDVLKAILESNNYMTQLYTLIQLAIREYVSALTLDELLTKKEEIANYVLTYAEAKASQIGLKVLYAGVKDIILPGDVKSIMNQVLIAEKQAQANVILRREETASTRSMLNTAKLMEDNPMLFKLKEMEYVEKIADKIGEITVSSNGNVLKQLNGIFSTKG